MDYICAWVIRELCLTFFGLSGALSEEQLVLFVWERFWKDSGHQRTDKHRRTGRWMSFNWSAFVRGCHKSLWLPHRVRQRQHAQAKEVDRQQQVDVLLRKHLRENTHESGRE